MATVHQLSVESVVSRRDMREFIRMPHAVYADDPHWVPPLDLERKEHLSRKNPFFGHGEAQLFLARRNGRAVGRISAQINRLHLERYGDATGFFGFLEAEEDEAVFRALFDAAENWLRERGMERVRGPFSYSINEESGLLVEGFDHPPVIMMGHARPWYGPMVEACGYGKAMDLIAYILRGLKPMPEAAMKLLGRLKEKGRLSVRPLNRKRLREELDLIMDIFNDAWANNWGYVPFTEAEIRKLGDDLNMIVEERDVWIASLDGEPSAMVVTLPDINEWIRDFGGRLLPFNWAKLIWRMKFGGPPRTVRMPLMGVRRKFHGKAVGSALALAVIDAARDHHAGRGVRQGELSWILETNSPTRKLIETLGGEPYKTYRVYEKVL